MRCALAIRRTFDRPLDGRAAPAHPVPSGCGAMAVAAAAIIGSMACAAPLVPNVESPV